MMSDPPQAISCRSSSNSLVKEGVGSDRELNSVRSNQSYLILLVIALSDITNTERANELIEVKL